MENQNWKYKVTGVKTMFEDKTTPELIIKLCSHIVPQLTKIVTSVENSNIDEDEKYLHSNELEELADNFTFLKELADGTIKEEYWDDYSFEGDFEGWFNDYLSQLYDIGDYRVKLKNGDTQKFIWIG